jgi:restriction system protein
MLATLKDGKTKTISEELEILAKHFNLTEEDLRIKVPSGQMGLFKNRLAWAISYLKNAGLLFYQRRGVYQITETGKKVLEEGVTQINIAYLKQFEEYKKWQSSFNQSEETIRPINAVYETKTPEEVLGDTFLGLKNKLGYELLEVLKNKPANYFEFFVLQLLSSMGYGGIEESNFEVVGQSGDNGIDGIIYQDKLGIDRIYVQAKRWKDNKVQSKDIRDFIGSLSLKGTNKGIFITTSEFTIDALKTATMNPQNRIILIDGLQLAEHAIEYNVGVQVKKIYEVKDIDIDFFEDI